MTTIYLVRHGETDWNAAGRIQGQEDTPLNPAGRIQAQHAGTYLQQWHWDALVASPLARAADTATIIGKAIGLALTTKAPELVERDYGVASGMTGDEIKARFPDGDIPGLELRSQVRARAMQGLTQLAQAYPGKRLIVVAHGGVINAILAAITDGEIGTGKTKLGNACISLLRYNGEESDKKWEIQSYNYQGHLPADASRPESAHIGVN